MMGQLLRHSGVRVILLVCIIGLIGFTAIDAWAVANRINMANANARALVGSDIEIVFDDGTTETTKIQEDGSFTTSKQVTERNVKDCFVVKKTPDGEEKRERPTCAWLWGGSAAATSSAAAAGGGGMTGGLMAGLFGTGGLELVIGGGGVTAFGGGNDGTSASSVSSSTTSGDSLVGSSLNLQLRAFPFTLHGIKLGAFAEFDQFFGANGTTGIAVFHPFGPNPQEIDTQTTRRLKRAYAFGLTQVIPIGGGFSIDFLQGIAFLQQEIEGESNEAKGGGTLVSASSSATNIVPKLGTSLEYQFPGSSISIRLASEFIYLPSQGTNAFSTFTNRPYSFSTDGTWTANAMLGFVIPFSVLAGQFQ